ncbi:MAG: carbohydrate kinase family protein [Patescibacteria group bacterium]
MKPFLVIGPLLLDVTVPLRTRHGVAAVLPRVHIGGKGFNISNVLAMLNVPVVLSTAYGQDQIGKFIQRRLGRMRIGNPKSNIVKWPTGIFVGVINDVGDTIYDKADTSIYRHQNVPQPDWRTISTVIVLSSSRLEIFQRLRAVKKRWPHLIFCLEVSGSTWLDGAVPFFGMFDFFICNEKEASALAVRLHAGQSIRQLIRHLHLRGVRQIFITQGKRGMTYGHTDGHGLVIRHASIHREPGRFVSTIGAGDTTTATLCAGLYRYQLPVQMAVGVAMKMAAYTLRQASPYVASVPRHIRTQLFKGVEK